MDYPIGDGRKASPLTGPGTCYPPGSVRVVCGKVWFSHGVCRKPTGATRHDAVRPIYAELGIPPPE